MSIRLLQYHPTLSAKETLLPDPYNPPLTLTDTSDLSGEYGVFRYDLEYGLTEDLRTAVSDHYPVYAGFWYDRDTD